MTRLFAPAILACALLLPACDDARENVSQAQASADAQAALKNAVICHKLTRWAAQAGPVADREAGASRMPEIARQWAQVARDQARLAGMSTGEVDLALSGDLEKPGSQVELNARIDDAWWCAAELEPGREQRGAAS